MATAEEKKRLVHTLCNELQEENLAIFAGAGLSVGAGFVNWAELLKPIADDLDLDINRESDLISLAQYHCNANGNNRSKLDQRLVSSFCEDAELTENHKILARLPIFTYWTTNYDRLLETALKDVGKKPDIKHTKKQLIKTTPNRDAIIYKMHGDVDHPTDVVLTKDDYERYHVDMQPFLQALGGDLISKTFLFLGFSFSDPNLDYILSRVHLEYRESQRQHYCILRNIQEAECEDKADYDYQKRKQGFFVQDLLRYGIKSLMIDEYSEVTEILEGVERQYRRNTVFISGAAHDYSPKSAEEASEFVYGLSKHIVETDFNVVSGFGLGIGSSVIAGALSHIYSKGDNIRSDQLVLRPFPQNPEDKDLWTDYRQDMLSFSGIAVFVFGNKLVDGEVVPSNGMREEFEIAKEKELFLLPIGATGYMAQELWEEVSKDFDTLNANVPDGVREEFLKLGDESMSFTDMFECVVKILDLLKS